jgi:hypothetical protein
MAVWRLTVDTNMYRVQWLCRHSLYEYPQLTKEAPTSLAPATYLLPPHPLEKTMNQRQPDPIRIVPLQLPQGIAAAPAVGPKLTYRGGQLLTAVEVYTIFWGKAWEKPPHADFVAKLNGFFDDILVSTLIDQLAEYSTNSQKIAHGSRIGTTTITTPPLRHTVTDAAIQHLVQLGITTGHFPQPTGNTLYFVYLPPGVAVVQGGARSCQAFCGYHNHIDEKIFYAAMPFPGCQGCTGQLAQLDALTSTSSHELCEAITDPVPGQGWYDDAHGEIGDICAWQTKQIGTHTVQLEWSNQANKCI